MPDLDRPSTPFDPQPTQRLIELDAGFPSPVESVPVEPARRRTRRTAIIATTAAVVVLAASGTAVARLWFGSTGALPEQAVPASTAAFVRINLTPGYAQRVKVLGLLGKFPTGAGTGGTTKGDPLAAYRSELLAKLDLGVSAQDVKGWFGDRAGVGVWVDSHGRPVQIAVLASSDDGAATKALRAARDKAGSDHLGFVVSGGYALLTKADKGAQAAAEEASKAAKTAALASNPHFRTALGALPDDEALVAYADLGQADKLAATGDSSTPTTKDELTGYLVSGAQAVDDGVEIRSRVTGMKKSGSGTQDALAALGATPGGPALAAVTGSLDTSTGLGRLAGVDGLNVWGLLVPELSSTTDDIDTGNGAAPALGETIDVEPSLGPDGKLHFVGPDGKAYAIDPNDPSTFPSDGSDPGSDADFGPDGAGSADFAAIGTASKAVVAAFGKATSIRLTVTGAPAKGQVLPAGELTVQLPDDASAKTFAHDLGTLTSAGTFAPPGAVTSEQHGTSVVARTSGYTAGSGTLAGDALFKEATAGGPAAPTTAVYVDVHKLATAGGAPAATLKQLGPVKAIGMTAGRTGDDTVAVIRIIIK